MAPVLRGTLKCSPHETGAMRVMLDSNDIYPARRTKVAITAPRDEPFTLDWRRFWQR